jgi:hypothetical protein
MYGKFIYIYVGLCKSIYPVPYIYVHAVQLYAISDHCAEYLKRQAKHELFTVPHIHLQ